MSVLFDGLSLGAIYALIALGYTMVYGIAKMLNFAHGDIIMVGAYAIFVTLSMGGHVAIALVASIVVCTVVGILIEKVAYKPLRGSSPLAVLITAIRIRRTSRIFRLDLFSPLTTYRYWSDREPRR